MTSHSLPAATAREDSQKLLTYTTLPQDLGLQHLSRPLDLNSPEVCPQDTFARKGSGTCTACAEGKFTTGQGAEQCEDCPNDAWNVYAWFCMSAFQRVVLLITWITTLSSCVFTVKKVAG